ncbi:hypothetical protein AB6A40_007446 [Gnathostoma spinigerum]|uniref:Uncharacterized protein n=1 Tax=Gnathostoma spinigerum TaxID=75299 RepID=A0ABD6EVY8_9BILA
MRNEVEAVQSNINSPVPLPIPPPPQVPLRASVRRVLRRPRGLSNGRRLVRVVNRSSIARPTYTVFRSWSRMGSRLDSLLEPEHEDQAVTATTVGYPSMLHGHTASTSQINGSLPLIPQFTTSTTARNGTAVAEESSNFRVVDHSDPSRLSYAIDQQDYHRRSDLQSATQSTHAEFRQRTDSVMRSTISHDSALTVAANPNEVELGRSSSNANAAT